MDVTRTDATAAHAMAATSPTPQGMISSDFQTFLRMLTVQLQHQDPLNPVEPTDYAVQLATFSGVEQQVLTNQLLGNLAAQVSLVGMAQLAGWIGQEARAPADVWFAGAPITFSPRPLASADRAVLVIRDAGGNIVSREDVPLESETYHWPGTDITGSPLPHGRYRATLESWRGGEPVQIDPVESYARIIEARGSAAGAVLVLAGGIEVPATAITALRQARD